MTNILWSSLGLFLIVFLGYLTKRLNMLSKADGTMLSMIVINITLPAAIIINLSRLDIASNLLLLILAGIIMNIVMIGVGAFLSKKQQAVERELTMYTVSGYNIGNFALPFLQSFLPQAIPAMSIFDIGNSIMLAGGATVVIETISGATKGRPSLLKIGKRLSRSVPFLCYLIMLVIRSFSIEIPMRWVEMIQPIASANTFLSMFMIGLFLELRLPKKDLVLVVRTLAIKYIFGGIIAVIIAMLPLPSTIKIVLCLVSLGPLTTFGVVNSVKAGARAEVVGFTSSISFLISLPLMTAILLLVV
ncbi:AEC family transporter [Enterococcus sp. 669A]|uniref:AEC family transporter n=1 Tax=Candidatus Enterococcus moelleringii TaxID=2815325 RepID=A0ABS3LD24_9ENTE|nr:AEC family transporter [Enterococcus sp. 669A]MBO1307537.1 AEC family transporter [Enterococcus sp. 669A]